MFDLAYLTDRYNALLAVAAAVLVIFLPPMVKAARAYYSPELRRVASRELDRAARVLQSVGYGLERAAERLRGERT